jgi:hypothetical protein
VAGIAQKTQAVLVGHFGYHVQVTDSLQGWGNTIGRTPQRPDGNLIRVVGNGHCFAADFEAASD